MADKQCIKVLVSGRVQGVFFRDSTRSKARRLGITGYAINLPDGRVEVLACGDRASLDTLVQWLHIGPPSAQVNELQSESVSQQAPEGFRIG